MKRSFLLTLVIYFLLIHSTFAQFIIQSNTNPTQLVQSLIGTGVSVSNATGQLYFDGAGTFSANNVTGFPFTNGLILSTGSLQHFDSTANYFSSTNQNNPGDPTLDAIVSPQTTYDAAVLEFDFSVASDSMEFRFIFSSEEYNEFANTAFNDVFGFFITGPGYTPGTNIAMLPGTATPIAINTVNNGNATGISSGPCLNCNYYVDNVFPLNNVALAADGLTVPILIRIPVQPCGQYHFKIAIADVSDNIFDSQVMFQQGSFQACPNMMLQANGTQYTYSDTLYLCAGDSMTLTAPTAPNYNWSTGETTQSIIVGQPGTYSMFVATSGLTTPCFAFSQICHVVPATAVPTPALTGSGDTIYCNLPQQGYNFTWNLNGFYFPGTQNYIVTTQPGCYTVKVKNGYQCEAVSAPFCLTGIPDNLTEHSFRILPNPVTGISEVQLPGTFSGATDVEFFSYDGKKVFKKLFNASEHIRFDGSNYPKGFYLMILTDTNSGQKAYSKVLIQ
ncbi:MAG TPA: choice-of-anchor L domain-containing protein [Bacteroidia bacterium]|nr:choice-of-anchor L domain-containing protein [Bacteroidia bacterium]